MLKQKIINIIRKRKKYLALISLIIVFYFLFSYIFAQPIIQINNLATQNYVKISSPNKIINVQKISNLAQAKLFPKLSLLENVLQNIKVSFPITKFLINQFKNLLPIFKIPIPIKITQVISYFLTVIYYITTYVQGTNDIYFSQWQNEQTTNYWQFGLVFIFLAIAFLLIQKAYGFSIWTLFAGVNIAMIVLLFLGMISIYIYIPVLAISLVYIFLRFMRTW